MNLKDLEDSIREGGKTIAEIKALQCNKESLTFGELENLYNSPYLNEISLDGCRIVLLLPDGIAAYFCHLILFKKQATLIPISTMIGHSRLEEILKQTEPHLILTTQPLKNKYCSILKNTRTLEINTLNAKGINVCQKIIGDLISSLVEITKSISFIPSDIRLIVFTSGSTGKPKGVCLTSKNILSAAKMNADSLALDRTRKSLITVPLYDYYGFIQIYSHLLTQASLYIGASITFVGDLFNKIKEGATDLVTVPHGLNEIVKNINKENHSIFNKLKVITTSSDLLNRDLLAKLFEHHSKLKLYDIYGLTEAGRSCFRLLDSSNYTEKNLGIPPDGVRIYLEKEADDPMGEITIEGPNVMLGYLQKIHQGYIETTECKSMHTGDIGYLDEKNQIVLVGRKDHIINLRGLKIHPIEIEILALQMPNVKEAKAALNSEGKVKLELVSERNGTIEIEKVLEHLKLNLNPIFVPSSITLVEDLIRTELGAKLIRK